MIVSIRPDMCIALRMIALQELYRRNQEFVDSLGDILGIREEKK